MSHAMQSHPKQARVKSSNKMCTTGGRNGDTPVFLGQEPYEQYENAKDKTREDKRARPLPQPPQGQKVFSMLQGNSGGQLLTATERTKQLDQSGNDSVVGMSGGKSKVGCCKEQYCTGTWNVSSTN